MELFGRFGTEMRNKQILIQNFHGSATRAIVEDFCALGYRVLMPGDDWDGKIACFMPNYEICASVQVELVSEADYFSMPQGDLLLGCIEHEKSLALIAKKHKDRIILHAPQNNVPFSLGVGDILLSPDIQTYMYLPIAKRMLYFPRVRLSGWEEHVKPLEDAWAEKHIGIYANCYQRVSKVGYTLSQIFAERYPIVIYGSESKHGFLEGSAVFERMSSSWLTLHFKEKEAYGCSVLESMLLGTPVISLRGMIWDKTLGVFLLNEENAILGFSIDELWERLSNLAFEDYVSMSKAAQRDAKSFMADGPRLRGLETILK